MMLSFIFQLNFTDDVWGMYGEADVGPALPQRRRRTGERLSMS
jgi:hypothetical protein